LRISEARYVKTGKLREVTGKPVIYLALFARYRVPASFRVAGPRFTPLGVAATSLFATGGYVWCRKKKRPPEWRPLERCEALRR
jgi:hypothetical protein